MQMAIIALLCAAGAGALSLSAGALLPRHTRVRTSHLRMADEPESPMDYYKKKYESKDEDEKKGWSILRNQDAEAQEDPPWLKRAKASPARAARQAAMESGGKDRLFASVAGTGQGEALAKQAKERPKTGAWVTNMFGGPKKEAAAEAPEADEEENGEQ